MKRILTTVALLAFLACSAMAQSTTVSATITDQGSQLWKNGTYSFVFQVSPSNPSSQYFWNGAPFSSSQTVQGNLDGTASFSASVPSNTAITPSGSTWLFQVCPAATATNGCFTLPLTITGATQSLTSTVVPPAVVVNLTLLAVGATAYTDSEITGAKTGGQYFNLSDSTIHACSGFPPCTWLSIGSSSSILPNNNTFTGSNTFTQPINGSITGNAATATTAAAATTATTAVTSTNLSGPGAITGTFSGSPTLSGTVNSTGTLNCTVINAVRCIDTANTQGWSGSDLGAWINAAETNCAGPCLIQVAPGAYTLSTATFIGNTAGTNAVSVQFATGVSITQSAIITVYANSSFLGTATSNANGLTGAANLGPLYITQANTSNLTAMIQCGDGTNNGNNCTLMNFQIDGNKTNNVTAGPNVLINKSSRIRMAYVTSQNSHSDGFRITASLTGEESAVPKLETILAFQNGGHGLSCINVNDGFVSSGSEFENDGGNGIDLDNCSGWRAINFDISFNTIGVYLHDSATGGNGSTLNFIDHFIANSNSQQDVFINGWDTGSSSVVNTGNQITNFILSGAVNRANQTYSAILSQDSQNNGIGPGWIGTGATGHAVKYCYEQKLVSSSGTTGDILNPFTCQRGATPLGDISIISTTKMTNFSANGSGLGQYTAIVASGVAPVLSGTGACATITSQSGAWAGNATCTGTTGASTLTLTFTNAAPHAWQCDASDVSTANALRQAGFTANNCTMSGTVNANDILVFKATAY